LIWIILAAPSIDHHGMSLVAASYAPARSNDAEFFRQPLAKTGNSAIDAHREDVANAARMALCGSATLGPRRAKGIRALMDSPLAVPSLADKVACLSRPESYAEGASAVEIIETHMSFVFLTDRYVYKLKKPVRYPFLDFRTLEARRFNCQEELRLNRRLARNVYLGVVPLALTRDGFELDGAGPPVEWLVKMRRLPRHLMLDRAIQEQRVCEQDLVRVTRVLSAFYLDAERIALTPADYRGKLRRAIEQNHDSLSHPEYGIAASVLAQIRSKELLFLEQCSSAFDARVGKNMIVEGHGDLRPEHVCLAAEPIFIDCLEFNRDLRIIDPADELAYLSMECEFAGAGAIRRTVFATYRACTGDDVSDTMLDFYASSRALLRARLAALHLEDHLTENDRTKWLVRARQYLRLAEQYSARLHGRSR
jgi:uncharacterized protein